MRASDVQHDMEQKIARLIQLANDFNSTKDISLMIEFKAIFKFIRTFLEFIRVHTNDKNARLTERCKNLYLIAGAIINSENSDSLSDNSPEKILAVWAKNYSDIHLLKLGKILSELDISNINPALFANFYRTHSSYSWEFRTTN